MARRWGSREWGVCAWWRGRCGMQACMQGRWYVGGGAGLVGGAVGSGASADGGGGAAACMPGQVARAENSLALEEQNRWANCWPEAISLSYDASPAIWGLRRRNFKKKTKPGWAPRRFLVAGLTSPGISPR